MLDWRTAYFNQARSDFALLQRLVEQDDVPLCQLLHYLQMATEKFAKGFLTPPGGTAFPKTHNAFQLFVRVCRDRPEIRRLLDFRDHGAFAQYINGLLPLAGMIENLSPEGEEHPNPEYPWVDANGNVQSPLTHDFTLLDVRTNPRMLKMLRFLTVCFQIAE